MSVRASASRRFELLGRHVLKGAEDGSFLGEGLLHGRAVEDLELRRLRQTEVEELRAGARDHDVPRLEIAMDHASAMRAVERLGDLRAVLENIGQRQRAALEPVGERLALEQLHDQIVIADVVKRADVRMVELRDRLRFALEPQFELRVLPRARREGS